MIEEVTIICDRCGIKVRGAKVMEAEGVWTSGYYDLTVPYWKQFALKNEKKICDECMFKDIRYQNR